MTMISLFLTLALAQDDPAAAIRALGEKISKNGLSGRLAEAAATDAGVQAIQEKIEFLLAAKISRFERDTTGHFEEYLFTADENGDLKLRPERQPEIDALVKRLPLAARAMTGFSRRADDLVRRLGDGPLEKRAKAHWSDPGFRTAFFHRHPAELRELDDDELVQAAAIRDQIASIPDLLEEVKKYEKSYLKLVAKVPDAAARELLSADTSALFLIGRVIRQGNEGAPAPIGALGEEGQISFAVDLAGLAADIKAGEKLLAVLPEAWRSMLMAERLLGLRQEQHRKCDEIMDAMIEGGFTAEGETLLVKKDRYESPEALDAELEGIIAEFNGTSRQDFDRIAERSVDPGVIALFEDRAGTYLLQEWRDRVVAILADQVRRQGIDVFIKTYLTKQGDSYVVRPERAARVEALLKRAADISAGK